MLYNNSILKNFKKSDLKVDNFPHIIIENALDPDFFKKLSDTFPDVSRFTRGKEIKDNSRYDIGCEDLDNEIDKVWRDFITYHSSYDFFCSVISKFNEHIQNSDNSKLIELLKKKLKTSNIKQDLNSNKTDIWHNMSLSINTKVKKNQASVRTPHIDNPNKIYGGLLYLRHPKDRCEGGNLELWKFKNNKKYRGHEILLNHVERFSEIDYNENTLVLFLNGDRSIHGVSERTETEYPRRFIYFTGSSNQIEMYDTSKNQLNLFDTLIFRSKRKIHSLFNPDANPDK